MKQLHLTSLKLGGVGEQHDAVEQRAISVHPQTRLPSLRLILHHEHLSQPQLGGFISSADGREDTPLEKRA